MIFGSVCSGIEAASVAWHGLGWRAAFFSEIEKFPCKLLGHHWPDVVNHGDMTKFKEWPDHAIDLLVGGTPCQSFSFAGLRKGLADPRGNLMLTYLAIVKRYRPRWVVWENVPGVLSSNKGRDFATFLGGLGQCGYGWAYRVLDAQYFGVAQRRRRVFVVGHIGSWQRAGAVLFERQSLCGNFAPSRETKKEAAGTLGARSCLSIGAQDADLGHMIPAKWPANVTQTLDAHYGNKMGLENQHINNGCSLFVTDTITTKGDCNNGFRDEKGLYNSEFGVRRLTPIECERLQGFPDNYTRLPNNNADAPRYKALGNSMAVPVMRWIGQRIMTVDEVANTF